MAYTPNVCGDDAIYIPPSDPCDDCLSANDIIAGDNITVDILDEGVLISATSTSLEVVLRSDGWSDDTQTVTATGVLSTSKVVISPKPTSYTAYIDAGVYCTALGTDSLTFAKTDAASSDITVNVLIL